MLGVLAEHIRTLVDASNTIVALHDDRQLLLQQAEAVSEQLSDQQRHTGVVDTIAGVSEALAASESSQQVRHLCFLS